MVRLIKEKNPVWDSGLKIVNPVIRVHRELLNVCSAIQDMIKGYEFSILAIGYWSEDGYIVTPQYYIPEQDVEFSSVDYKEDIGVKRAIDGFTTVIHSHGSNGYYKPGFSGADDDNINSNFECSLLYDRGEISDYSLKIKISDGLFLRLESKNIKEILVYDDQLPEIQGFNKIRAIPRKEIKVHELKAEELEEKNLKGKKRKKGKRRDKMELVEEVKWPSSWGNQIEENPYCF